MFYQTGSPNYTMKIDDKTNSVSKEYIGVWADKYHKFFKNQPNGASLTMDFFDKNGDIVTFFVKKINDVITINHLVFDFKDGPREMTNYIDV